MQGLAHELNQSRDQELTKNPVNGLTFTVQEIPGVKDNFWMVNNQLEV